jgi:hypothetical protein
MVSAAITSNGRCRLCDEHWHAKILERNHPCTDEKVFVIITYSP